MHLTKTYYEVDKSGKEIAAVSIKVEYDKETNTVGEIIEAWTYNYRNQQLWQTTPIIGVLMNEFNLDKKVDEICWYDVFCDQKEQRIA